MLIKPGFTKRCSIPVLCDGTPPQGQGLCCAGAGDLPVPEATISGPAGMGTMPWALLWGSSPGGVCAGCGEPGSAWGVQWGQQHVVPGGWGTGCSSSGV